MKNAFRIFQAFCVIWFILSHQNVQCQVAVTKQKVAVALSEQLFNPKTVDNLQLATWDASAEYYINDLVEYKGVVYISNEDGTNKEPGSNTSWRMFEQLSFSDMDINTWMSKDAVDEVRKKYKSNTDSVGRIRVTKDIIFFNCTIQYLNLDKINLEGSLRFVNSNILNLEINNSHVKDLDISGGSGMKVKPGEQDSYIIYFDPIVTISNSSVENVNMSKVDMAESYRNVKPTFFASDAKFKRISIEDPEDQLQVRIIDSEIAGMPESPLIFFLGRRRASAGQGLSNIEMRGTTIGNRSDSSVMHLQGGFSGIVMDRCTSWAAINFFSSSIRDQLRLSDSKMHKTISFTNTSLPLDLKIRWNQLEGQKISKFLRTDSLDRATGTFMTTERIVTSDEIGVADLDHFEDIMRSYQVLFASYKAAGDLTSSNGCYAEMKDIQTRRLKYLYSQAPSFKSYFQWQLSALMKFYTNHGTDPARAIVISIWVVFFFGVFYFFFPSDWDLTSKPKLIQNYKDFINKNDKGYIKPFILLLAGFSVSMLNAMTLSLNSFTTLGFGNIPTHGIAKYFCVLEGFIGWFLLSIFTVALINQVLG